MINNISRKTSTCLKITTQFFCKCNHTKSEITLVDSNNSAVSVIDTKFLPTDDFVDVQIEHPSPLDKCTEDISHVAPYLKPTFNFAAYVNKSETLQQLLKLGVNLYKLEQKITVPQYILGLDFEKDIKNHVLFFHDNGLAVDGIGATITKNPYILKQNIDDLKVRINYLVYKKFDKNMIIRILQCNPFWLMFNTKRIDRRLGFFQHTFKLTGDEVRKLACKQPKLITYEMKHIKLNHFVFKEEMGFSPEDLKHILLRKPKLYMINQQKMLLTYEYVINVMKIPLETLVQWPEILTCREFRIKQRHLFLETLGRAQFNPKLPNYASLLTLVSGSDADFAVNVAKSSLQAYNAFLKTL